MNAELLAVAERGDKIYRERYKAEYEKSHPGMFGVIDVDSGRIFVAETPEEAFQVGVSDLPKGRFYLLKIGTAGVYRVAYSRSDTNRGDRIFQGA